MRFDRVKALAIGAVVLAVVGVWYLNARQGRHDATVARHRWTRDVPIEEYSEHTDNTWADQVPADAHDRSCRQKTRSYHSVPDPHCTRTKYHSCPPLSVADDSSWCTYHVTGWHQVDTLRASGEGLVRTWPAGAEAEKAEVAGTPGARRQGKRSESFELDFDDGTQCLFVSEATWLRLHDGDEVSLRMAGTLVNCTALEKS